MPKLGDLGDTGFNFADVEPNAGSEPLPVGWQHFRVERWEESETGENSANPGSLMYRLSVSAIGGNHDGQWIFPKIVLDPSSTVFKQNIGRFKGLCAAVGIDEKVYNDPDLDPDDDWGSENLVGREFDGKVTVSKAKDGYDPSNDIREYRPHEYTEADLTI